MEKIKTKQLDSMAFTTIKLTPEDAYMMTVSGTHFNTKDLKKVMNQPIKDFIIGEKN